MQYLDGLNSGQSASENLCVGGDGRLIFIKILILVCPNRHFQLNPILIWEFEMVVRIMFLRDIVKDNM